MSINAGLLCGAALGGEGGPLAAGLAAGACPVLLCLSAAPLLPFNQGPVLTTCWASRVAGDACKHASGRFSCWVPSILHVVHAQMRWCAK